MAAADAPDDVLRFAVEGIASIQGLLSDADCEAVAARVRSSVCGSAGTRNLLSQAWCRQLAARLLQYASLSSLVPPSCCAVQCTYFEKSASRNWLVPMHQDLSIPVAARVDHPALQGWSEKEGVLYVQAPQALLEEMVALRLHLDPCGVDDGPLRVVPGSHRAGPMLPDAAARMRKSRSELVCIAEPGCAWVMRPLLLHASSKSTGSGRRRVLHFLFGPRRLPFGLRWHRPDLNVP